jgi:hypothetical protein
MRIPKCTKTVSGKHKWIDGYWIPVGALWDNPPHPDEPFWMPKRCAYCGVVDDRLPKPYKEAK